MAGRAFVLKGLDESVRGTDLVVEAMESVLIAVGAPVDKAPGASRPHFHLVHDRLVFSRSPPLRYQIGVGARLEHQVAGRAKYVYNDDLLLARLGDNIGLSHCGPAFRLLEARGGFPPVGPVSLPRTG